MQHMALNDCAAS